MMVFLVIAILAAVGNGLLGDFANPVVYAFMGFLCGLVLRTRLEGGVARMLVVCFFAIGFPIAGYFTPLMFGAEPIVQAAVHGLVWGVAGAAVSLPYLLGSGKLVGRLKVPLIAALCFGVAGAAANLLGILILILHPAVVCLAAGVFDLICENMGLKSPEEEFQRLRIRFEFRLR